MTLAAARSTTHPECDAELSLPAIPLPPFSSLINVEGGTQEAAHSTISTATPLLLAPPRRPAPHRARLTGVALMCATAAAGATDAITYGGYVLDISDIIAVASLLISASLAWIVIKRAAGQASEATYNWYIKLLTMRGEQVESLLKRCTALENRAQTAEDDLELERERAEAALDAERRDCDRKLEAVRAEGERRVADLERVIGRMSAGGAA